MRETIIIHPTKRMNDATCSGTKSSVVQYTGYESYSKIKYKSIIRFMDEWRNQGNVNYGYNILSNA